MQMLEYLQTNPFPHCSTRVSVLVPADRVLLVLNKADLLPQDQRQNLDGELGRVSGLPPVCLISCHTAEGLQDFLAALHSAVRNL